MSQAPAQPGRIPPGPRQKPGRARRLLDWLALGFLLGCLALGAAGWWLSQFGLPEVCKQRVLAGLRQAGWSVDFTRLRWSPRRGLVVENFQLERAQAAAGPKVFADSAQCVLSPVALRSLQFRVEAVRVAGGRLLWSWSGTNETFTRLIVSEVNGAVRFKSTNLWELDGLRATLWGVRVKLDGSLTNAALVREWKLPRGEKKTPGPARPAWWSRLMSAADEWQFGGVPEVSARFYADAGNFASSQADLRITAPSVVCPYGSGTNLWLSARLMPSLTSNAPTRVKLELLTGRTRTPWGSAGQFKLEALLEPMLTRWLPTNSALRMEARDARTPWASAASAVITHQLLPCPTNDAHIETVVTVQASQLVAADVRAAEARLVAHSWHPATNWTPATVSGDLHVERLETPRARAGQSDLVLRGTLPGADQFSLLNTNLAWPDRLTNVELAATAVLRQVEAGGLQSEQLSLTNRWQAQRWELEVGSQSAQGGLHAEVDLHAMDRELRFRADSTLDPFQFAPLLGTNARRWLARARWQTPPQARLHGRVVLPGWTNRAPDWKREVLPSLEGAGQLRMGPCAFDGAEFQGIDLPFALTNLTVNIRRAVFTRPEGQLSSSLTTDLRDGDFRARLRSGIDPQAFKPWLAGADARRAFDFAAFTQPPVIEGEVWGRFGELARLGACGRLEATNFTLRGERVGLCRTGIRYTNQIIECVEPRVERPGEWGTAPLVTIDVRREILILTNAQGNLDPYALTRVIGPKAARAIAPYRFESPPNATASGVVDLKQQRHHDHLRLRITGGPFQWEVFHLQALQGEVEWQGETVTLTNVLGKLHGGELRGNAYFDFGVPVPGTDFAFQAQAEELNLRSLMRDINPGAKTNKLEGNLSGTLVIHRANTSDLASWQGEGNLKLVNGVLWDIPMFGLFSPVLNAFAPGLGNSRAREGRATFGITNSVIRTKDLQIHATAMRMQFAGAVDFTPRVDGRMEAELLRDVPGIGFFVSKVLWPVTKLFEYKLTGPLNDPKKEPLYLLPKIILLPLQPFRALKDMFTPEARETPEAPEAPPEEPKL